MSWKLSQKIFLKTLVGLLEFLAIVIFLYLIISPFYQTWRYSFAVWAGRYQTFTDLEQLKTETKKTLEPAHDNLINNQNQAEGSIINLANSVEALANNQKSLSEPVLSKNRLIIKKIGLNAPIIESESESFGLNHGAWRYPRSSTPDLGGNTVITGHRFKYLPPNNLTFYLFDKLEVGDLVAVVWQGQDYYYRIRETKIVQPEDISVLAPSTESILTMFTCHPVFSQAQRLVIVADLIED